MDKDSYIKKISLFGFSLTSKRFSPLADSKNEAIDNNHYYYNVVLSEIQKGSKPKKFSVRNGLLVCNINNFLAISGKNLRCTGQADGRRVRMRCGVCFSHWSTVYTVITSAGGGCPVCSGRKKITTQEFIFRANILHNNKYTYENTEYTGTHNYLNVNCKLHGEFEIVGQAHLQGYGCNKCRTYSDNMSFVEMCKKTGRDASIYLISLSNKTESFIKVGVTSKLVSDRATHWSSIYDTDILLESSGAPDKMFELEQHIISKYSDDRYIPENTFGGHTECFTRSVIDKIYKEIKHQDAKVRNNGSR